jgi:hypothetical protein
MSLGPRSGVLSLAVVVASGLAVGACGGDNEDGEAAVRGTFVGELSGTDAFVALVADEPGSGEDERAVRL